MARVLITGAAGYIGGRLLPVLSAAGHSVRTLVREPAPWLDGEQVVCDLAADGSDPAVGQACDGVDCVIHLAGENEVLADRRPAAALGSTVVGTERVAEAAAAAGVTRLLYLSTVHVYGARMMPGATLTEDLRPEPRSAYATARLASEHVAATFAVGAYELIVLRLTNSVGAPRDPRVDRWSLVANDLCRQGALRGELKLRSSGMQWRDFVSLVDVCAALRDAVGGQLPAGTYNIASGSPMTVRALAELVQASFVEQTGRRPPLDAPEPEADPPGPYRVSTVRAAAAGLRLISPVAGAVAETVRFCLDRREELR